MAARVMAMRRSGLRSWVSGMAVSSVSIAQFLSLYIIMLLYMVSRF